MFAARATCCSTVQRPSLREQQEKFCHSQMSSSGVEADAVVCWERTYTTDKSIPLADLIMPQDLPL